MSLGRLYWKFFFFILLAQLTAVVGVAGIFWLERQQDHARWAAAAGVPPTGGGLGVEGAPSHDGRAPPPPPHASRQAPGMLPPPSPGAEPPADRLPPPVSADGVFHPHHGGHRLPGAPNHLPLVPVGVGLLASFVFAALLAWYFSKPIRSLRTAFDAASAGDLDVRASPAMGGRRDELADLGRDFDRMAGRLRDLLDAQRRLLHDVSHELRSPLARLQAAIGLMRQQPARQEDSLQRIERESERIDRLVGELLTLSRLEAGVAPPMEEDIAVGELLADIAQDAAFEAEAKGRQVVCRVAGEVMLRGNGELLLRAIENVVRNAIRHTPEGGTVEIEAAPAPNAGPLRLAILDAGPGVPEADLATIFEPFRRSGEAYDGSGYGLGLAIAKRVVEAHGGRIAATNRAGGGLCVEILLPVLVGGAVSEGLP